MFRNLMTYIDDKEFKLTFLRNRLNIVYYKEIITVEQTRISISYDQGTIVVHGKNLTINKLLEQELLITGEIETIELRG